MEFTWADTRTEVRYIDVCDHCGDPCENVDSYSDCCNEPVVSEAKVIKFN